MSVINLFEFIVIEHVTVVGYGAVITLKNHRGGGGLLHSHPHLYPEEMAEIQQQQVCSTVYLSHIHLLIHPPTHLAIHSLSIPSTHPPTHSFNHSSVYSSIHPPTCSTNSFTHPYFNPIHPFLDSRINEFGNYSRQNNICSCMTLTILHYFVVYAQNVYL
jgi:hypothetical protein